MVNLLRCKNFFPRNFDGTYAQVFFVNTNGNLNNNNVNNTNIGVRPISFLTSHIRSRLNIVELGYKINQ